MKQATMAISEFKAKCLRLLEDVEAQGLCLTITKRGRPIAKVVPFSVSAKPLRGSWKGLVKIKGDIVHFDTSSDWDSVE